MEHMSQISMIIIVNEHIGLHYLLIEWQLYTLILLELNMFLHMYYTKSETNQSLTTDLE